MKDRLHLRVTRLLKESEQLKCPLVNTLAEATGFSSHSSGPSKSSSPLKVMPGLTRLLYLTAPAQGSLPADATPQSWVTGTLSLWAGLATPAAGKHASPIQLTMRCDMSKVAASSPPSGGGGGGGASKVPSVEWMPPLERRICQWLQAADAGLADDQSMRRKELLELALHPASGMDPNNLGFLATQLEMSLPNPPPPRKDTDTDGSDSVNDTVNEKENDQDKKEVETASSNLLERIQAQMDVNALWRAIGEDTCTPKQKYERYLWSRWWWMQAKGQVAQGKWSDALQSIKMARRFVGRDLAPKENGEQDELFMEIDVLWQVGNKRGEALSLLRQVSGSALQKRVLQTKMGMLQHLVGEEGEEMENGSSSVKSSHLFQYLQSLLVIGKIEPLW